MWFSNPYGMPTDQRVPVEGFIDDNIVKLSVASVIFVIVIIIIIICHSRISASSCQRNKRSMCCYCCGCIDADRRLKLVSHDMGSDCAICLEPKDSKTKQVVMLTCNHSYHQACVSRWLEMDDLLPKCPQCRRQPGKFSTTERFISIIKTLVMKRKERTFEAKTIKREQTEKEEKMLPGHIDLREFGGFISPEIDAVTIV